MTKKPNELRIIGGKWRSRKLKFAPQQYLRPTTNIVRETLFNWLDPIINEAICLDFFAGTGSLGFEALSRGAKHVTMVDKSIPIVSTLKKNATLLEASNIDFFQLNFSPNLKNPFLRQFNLVFIDPPFHKDLIAPCCVWLEQNNCLTQHALIYIEAEKDLKPLPTPVNWELLREKTSGQVTYYLFRRK